jgi:hypothetical protein
VPILPRSPGRHTCTVISRQSLKLAPGTLAVVGIVAISAACSGSPEGSRLSSVGATPGQHQQTSSSDTSASAEHDACRYLTSEIVAKVQFNYTVNRIKDRADSGGVSLCSFGDEPDPTLLSVNVIYLIETQPAFLTAHHTTAFAAATSGLDSSGCVNGSIRRVDVGSGVNPRAVLCVGKPGSVRGGWAQCGDGYYLSYYSPPDADRSVPARLHNFQKLVQALAAKIGECGPG